jgi:ABC-type branched-subunit amino acid transport system ATPase component
VGSQQVKPAPWNSELLIGAREIVKRSGHVQALSRMNLKFRLGEVLALFGDNRTGKPDLKGIYTTHSNAAVGTSSAVIGAGLSGKIKINDLTEELMRSVELTRR